MIVSPFLKLFLGSLILGFKCIIEELFFVGSLSIHIDVYMIPCNWEEIMGFI